MPIITLTTDLGLKDFYVSAVKGAIYSQFPEANVVDITHLVPPFDILQASFIVKNAYKNFPKGTVHIIGVNAEPTDKNVHVALYADGHYFIGSDNGIFSLLFDKKPDQIVELNLMSDSDHFIFPTKNLFVKAACHIARGGTLEVIGTAKENVFERSLFRNVPEESVIKGIVIYIDNYENVFTNISKESFKETGKGRPFTIFLKRYLNTDGDYVIQQISNTYQDVPDGEKLALFSTTGEMEIAINKGNAASLLGLRLGDTIRIEFHDRENR
jgi:S-adenosyl-L-methionine hydrolase (adenosine-forming)